MSLAVVQHLPHQRSRRRRTKPIPRRQLRRLTRHRSHKPSQQPPGSNQLFPITLTSHMPVERLISLPLRPGKLSRRPARRQRMRERRPLHPHRREHHLAVRRPHPALNLQRQIQRLLSHHRSLQTTRLPPRINRSRHLTRMRRQQTKPLHPPPNRGNAHTKILSRRPHRTRPTSKQNTKPILFFRRHHIRTRHKTKCAPQHHKSHMRARHDISRSHITTPIQTSSCTPGAGLPTGGCPAWFSN
jgi:hypothetical protein